MSAIKVLHIFGKMDRGGAEMRTLDLMRALRETDSQPKIQFDFCVLSGQRGELDDVIRELGGSIHYLPLKLGFSRKFKQLLKISGYASVHSHVHLFSGYLLRLAHTLNIASRICHLHTTGGYGEGRLRKRLQNFFMLRWLGRHATAIIAVSHGAKRAFLDHAPHFATDTRLHVIYDAIDPQLFTPSRTEGETRALLDLTHDQTVIIHVGRLDPVKNHTKLLEVFAEVLTLRPQARLIMVGKTEPTRLATLSLIAQSLQISEKIRFLGARADVADLLAYADLMIFPSLWEGLPGAVLEAAAAGVPVLSSELPGSRELAEYFNRIRLLSLNQSHTAWAHEAQALLILQKNSASAHAALLQSPFNVSNALKKLIPLWRPDARER